MVRHDVRRGYTRLDYTDTGTFTGADADPMFDADDEVVFMASDAGGPAETTTEPPGTLTGSGVEVVLTDPLAPGSWYVYLFRGDGSLDQSAGQQVGYQFSLTSGAYLTTYQLLNGPNPENTTVSTAAYSRHFSDRWTQDQLRISPALRRVSTSSNATTKTSSTATVPRTRSTMTREPSS